MFDQYQICFLKQYYYKGNLLKQIARIASESLNKTGFFDRAIAYFPRHSVWHVMKKEKDIF